MAASLAVTKGVGGAMWTLSFNYEAIMYSSGSCANIVAAFFLSAWKTCLFHDSFGLSWCIKVKSWNIVSDSWKRGRGALSEKPRRMEVLFISF